MPQKSTDSISKIPIFVLLGIFAIFAGGSLKADPLGDLTVKIEVTDPGPILDPGTLCVRITVINMLCSSCRPFGFTNVQVSTPLPDAVSFLSSDGCDEDPDGNPTCTVGSVLIEQGFNIDLKVNEAGQSLNLCSTILPTSNPVDPNPDNNMACVTLFGTDLIFRDGFESGDLTAWTS